MKVKNFTKSKIHLHLPYLLDPQIANWKEFWAIDLKELFEEISPIRDYTKKEYELWFLDYKLGESKYKDEFEAKENNDSYAAPLRAMVKLIDLRTKEEKIQEVYLADFPLMTSRGTFIINGVERVVIAQLLRSPGAFFTAREIHGKRYFGGRIIPSRGSWLEFETDPSGFIGVKIDRKRRVPVTTILKAFGFDSDDNIKKAFFDVDKGDVGYIEETLKRDTTHSQPEAYMEIYKRLRPGDLASADTAKELIDNMFFNFERYDLSKVGRWKSWQRLPEIKPKNTDKISPKDRVLTKEDVVAVVREIIRLNNTPESEPDQIDHLGNRRVKMISELLRERIRIGLTRMERIIKDKMSTLDPIEMAPAKIINPRPFMAVVKQFFSSSQLSQFMDNENLLSELEHKRRLTAGGPGGLTRKRAGLQVRDVQPSHYGRICPIQTPEGPNVGLVVHLANYARINQFGFIETPYFKVSNGKVLKEVLYLNAFEEEKHNIANAGLAVDENNNILAKEVVGRIKGEPGMIERKDVDFMDVAPEQLLSVTTSLIPFLQNDDANRALMGSNMQRQSVPLIEPEVPVVSTGLEDRIAQDSGHVVLSKEDGIVTAVDAKKIVVKGKSGEAEYDLKIFRPTNQYTSITQRPIINIKETVKKGQPLADGPSTKDGVLALGKNILVAFLSWRGYNYEDGVIISQRLVEEDVLSSVHIETLTCDVRETKLGPEVTTADIPNVSEEKLKDLDEEGIVRIGAEVNPNDILVGKISPKGEADLTPEERLLLAIFGEKAKNVKDTSLLMEHGKKGRVVGVKIFSPELGHKLEPGIVKRIQVEVAQWRKITVGDKIAGRHGNKGIISTILPKEEMPFLEDGSPVDIVLNPLSVASRMNLGQILETHLGWAAHTLGYRSISPALSGAKEKDIKEELKAAGLPEDGKAVLFDGRTGERFPEKVTVGYVYIMKLVHMVSDKIHMRSIGPYSLITQQPLGGRSQFGGQRFGEMEVWALEGYGAANTLQEMLTIKSDDVLGRAAAYQSILKGKKIETPNIPASFSLLVNELKSLGLNVELNLKEKESKDE
ncbi:MAG: DNA-directed RNA polymerase subunit beta [Candidatus Pacebacteria bacterium]|nr:DNA-directed RNA polymerase subunit beta [Candidatus Paceibacterota bacterium]